MSRPRVEVALAALERCLRHAERFGVELVLETAAGLGEPEPGLTVGELVDLARRLKAIDARFDAARPDKVVELDGVEVRDAYRRRIAPVLDALAVPAPTRAARCCEWCGRPIAGHAHGRTCSPRCRKRLARADSAAPFTRPNSESDPSIAPDRNVTVLPREQRVREAENRRGLDFREVSPGGLEQQLGLFEEIDA